MPKIKQFIENDTEEVLMKKNDSNDLEQRKLSFLNECYASARRLDLYEEAMYAVDRALQIKPENDEWWHRKGKVYFELKEYDNAEMAFTQALAIKPEKSIAKVYLGFVKEKQGSFLESQELLYQASKERHNDTKLLTTVAESYLKSNPYRALELSENALSEAPAHLEASTIRDQAIKILKDRKRKTSKFSFRKNKKLKSSRKILRLKDPKRTVI